MDDRLWLAGMCISIDLGVQAIVRQSLLIKLSALRGWRAGLVMDMQNGDYQPCFLPDYDPNHFADASEDALFNRATRAYLKWVAFLRC